MEALVLVGGFACVWMLGLWATDRLDRFFADGGFLPDPGGDCPPAQTPPSSPPSAGAPHSTGSGTRGRQT